MKKVLFVCSANKERSPTAEQVFKDVPNWIVKSAGTEIDNHHMNKVLEIYDVSSKIHVLEVEDRYYRCSPELIGLLINKMSRIFPLDDWAKMKFGCRSQWFSS
jgi:predicted protein tyrosine phosphatase